MARVFKHVWTKPLADAPADRTVAETRDRRTGAVTRTVRYRDTRGQRREGRLSADGLRIVFESTTYSLEYRDALGAPRRMLAYTDQRASAELAELVDSLVGLRVSRSLPDAELAKRIAALPARTRDALVSHDLLDAANHAAARPLAEHLAAYKQALLDGAASRRQKGPATTQHATLTVNRIQAVLDGVGAVRAADLTPERVGRFLATRREAGLSAKSSNHYAGAIVAFLNWMLRNKRATENPLTGLAKLTVNTRARKHVRRSLEVADVRRLLDAAAAGPERHGMTGAARYWLYRLAVETGLRSGELRSLTRASFKLDDAEPHVWLPGDDTKNREPAELPLRAETVAGLREHLAELAPAARVFAMPRPENVVKMLRGDLDAAGIAYRDSAGRVSDFHALRVSFISWLAAANVPMKVIQRLARHSTPMLTMNTYARTLVGAEADAVAALPDLGADAVAATGTDGRAGRPVYRPSHRPFLGALRGVSVREHACDAAHSRDAEHAEFPVEKANSAMFAGENSERGASAQGRPQRDSNPCSRLEKPVS